MYPIYLTSLYFVRQGAQCYMRRVDFLSRKIYTAQLKALLNLPIFDEDLYATVFTFPYFLKFKDMANFIDL